MNYYGAQLHSLFGRFEDSSVAVVCPRPRRIDRPDFEAGDELLELLLSKGEEPNQIDLSDPFFCGSPPSRVSNPVIHDQRFRNEMSFSPFVPVPMPSSVSIIPPSSSSSPRQTFMPTKFGYKPAAMRIEGFDNLNSDRSCNSITAKA